MIIIKDRTGVTDIRDCSTCAYKSSPINEDPCSSCDRVIHFSSNWSAHLPATIKKRRSIFLLVMGLAILIIGAILALRTGQMVWYFIAGIGVGLMQCQRD